MKKSKIIFKVIYYIFMIIVVLLLAVVLPNENQYSLINDCIKTSLKNENYSQIPALFSSYYNDKAVASITQDDYKIELFESSSTNPINDSNTFYSQSIYTGLIINASGYNYGDLKDANDKTYNNTRLVISDGENTSDVDLDVSFFAYLNSNKLIYFEISEYDFAKSNLDKITSLSFYQNDNTKYIEVNNLDLDFDSQFFTEVEKYNDLYNSLYMDVLMSLTGNFDKQDESTTLSVGSAISFKTVAQTLINVNSSALFKVTSNGTLLNPNLGTTTYTFPAGAEVTLTAESELNLTDIIFTYDNNLSFAYSFGNKTYPNCKRVYSFDASSKEIGKTYNEESIQTEYSAWQETYSFAVTNYQTIVSGATPRAIGQVVLIIILFLIVGDFLVGDRWIWRLIVKLYNKIKKKNPNDETSEVTPEFNDYEVNVECKFIVPEEYDASIHIVYKIKDKDISMTFDLTKEMGYKATNRFRNGVYELLEFDAPGLELDEPKEVLNVRGYKYVLELKTKKLD